jgi:hypothetical protein
MIARSQIVLFEWLGAYLQEEVHSQKALLCELHTTESLLQDAHTIPTI